MPVRELIVLAVGRSGQPTPILNEAFECADPLRLMRLFGITEQTATRDVTAAHPERTAQLPV
ncbi:hypothetical protein GCM10010129_58530 [Streptomyces fumigatiscleroticus]|nr:hypothetical protein GCM10010129_58530 [Streptomyces fumigatiscleroticus]